MTDERLARLEEKTNNMADTLKDIGTTLKLLVSTEIKTQDLERRINSLEGTLNKLAWGLFSAIGAIVLDYFIKG